jgi:two-component system chemotaxis sensor kinase CheA
MVEKDSDFLKRLLKTFRLEAQEHIEALFAGIDEIEKSTDAARKTSKLF